MKQYIKRVLLVLCMTVSLFSLSACSAGTETKGKELDPMTAMGVSQSAEGLLQNIVALDEAQAQELEATLLADKEYGLAGGVTSWMSVMKDTGAFVGVISSDTVLSEDDEYVSTVMAQFKNRNAEFKMFMTEGDQGLMPTSIAFTPEYTFGEKMEKAAMNTLLGMGTVFMVLIFISLIIAGMKFVNIFEAKMKAKQETAAPAAPAPAVEAAEAEEEELVDDLELVAVITAAIAAASNSSTDGLVVRSIKRAPGAKWKRA